MKKWLVLLLLPLTVAATPVVVFDFGGVMAHPDRSIALQFLCKSFNFSEKQFQEAQGEIRSQVDKGSSVTGAWCDYARQKGITLPSSWPRDFEAVQRAAIGADPEMYALVDELKEEGVQVALLSNVECRHARLLRALGLYAPFDPVVLSCEIGVDKPDPKAYRILLQQVGRPPQQVIFIDDKPANIATARAVGIDGILYESPEQVRESLEERGLLNAVRTS
ncbi:MAG: HAD family hydrolase [Hyphomicrobium sp.]